MTTKCRVLLLVSVSVFLFFISSFGATEVVKTVCQSGCDYASLSAWESAEEKNLVAADEVAVAQIEGSWSAADGAVTVDGWTTDATRYIRIITTGQARHAGVWDDSKYRIQIATETAAALYIRESYTIVDGLQVEATSHNSTYRYGISVYGLSSSDLVTGAHVRNCIVRNSSVSAANRRGITVGVLTSHPNHVYNNIVYGFDNATSNMGIMVDSDYGTAPSFVFSNTVANCDYGIRCAYDRAKVVNNVVYATTTPFDGTMWSGSDYNATDGADSTGGEHNTPLYDRQNQTFSFVAAASNDYRLLSTDMGAKDYGSDLSADPDLAFTTDAASQTRSAPWDIGAYEVVGPPVEKDSDIYYSIGANTAALYSGTASASSKGLMVLGGTAANSIGVGDEVQVGSYRYYIRRRESTTNFRIQNSNANGGTPGDTNITFSSQSVEIYRAFNTLLDAVETGAMDVNHLNTFDLVSNNYMLNLPYYGDGAEDSRITIANWASDATHHVRIYAPSLSTEVGTSQRHAGVWDDTKARMVVSNGNYAITLVPSAEHVKIEGMQFRQNGSGSCIRVESNYTKLLGNILVRHDTGNEVIFNNRANIFIVNNVMVNGDEGISNWGSLRAYNNTIINCVTGLNSLNTGNSAMRAKNNIVQGATTAYSGEFYAGSDYNVSSDASNAGGANDITNATVQFADAAGGDYHLAIADNVAKGAGMDLSADADYPFSDDIDGETRETPWDIGADENEVQDNEAPSMGAITAPAGGATWGTGDAATISWSATDNIALSSFVVKLSSDNGASWTQIADTSAGNAATWSGDLAYTAPTNVVSATCLIRVIAYDATNVDSATTAAFSIADNDAPVIAVTSPNGAEGWPAAGVKDIEWSESENIAVASCSLYYSLNNADWTFIAVVAGNTKTYSWTLPDQQSVCWVRVVAYDAANNRATDDSDAEFSITSKPYFTCDDSVHVDQGGALNFNLDYDQGGIPGAAIVTALEKPSWVFQVGSVLLGTAPAEDRVDTARVELDVSGIKDTLTLRIFIGTGGVDVKMHPTAVLPVGFGMKVRSTPIGTDFTISNNRFGNVRLEIYDVRGRKVFHHEILNAVPGMYQSRWDYGKWSTAPRQGSYLVFLRRGGEQVVDRISVIR